MQRSQRKKSSEDLKLRFALSDYFLNIQSEDELRHMLDNPSAPRGYMNPKFQSTFEKFSTLMDDNIESGRLNVRPLAKLMNEFSEMLISSGIYKREDLISFWRPSFNTNEVADQSARLKEMDATTLSEIVGRTGVPQRRPHRPGSQRSANKRPTVR